jgi:hypothetical protein
MRRVLKYFGLWWFVVAMVLRFTLQVFSSLQQGIWFEGVFPFIQKYQYLLCQWLPLPGYTLLIIAMALWLIWRIPKTFKKRDPWLRFGRRLANLLGGLAASFLMLWGYNYLNTGLDKRLGIERVREPALIADAYIAVMERALANRSKIEGIDEVAHIEAIEWQGTDEDIEQWVRAILEPLGYPAATSITVRHIVPEGTLQRLGILGIYNPWTGEANVESALGSLKTLFTTAHEMAHAFGVTSEAEANFTAYLACLSANDPLANYAAEYALWRSIGHEVNRGYGPEEIAALAAAIPEELHKDREAIWRNASQHTAYLPEVSTAMNDAYLKLQGVSAGVEDYNEFVALYLAWADKVQPIGAPKE